MALKELFGPPPAPPPPPRHEGAAFAQAFGLQRYHAHQQRLARSKPTVTAPNAQAAAPVPEVVPDKKAAIAAALAKARQLRKSN